MCLAVALAPGRSASRACRFPLNGGPFGPSFTPVSPPRDRSRSLMQTLPAKKDQTTESPSEENRCA